MAGPVFTGVNRGICIRMVLAVSVYRLDTRNVLFLFYILYVKCIVTFLKNKTPPVYGKR